MAAMAIADGQQSELSSDQIEAHLANCSECRREIGELRTLSSLLNAQQWRQQTADLWQRVEQRLPNAAPKPSTSVGWQPLIVLSALLLGYRLVEMVPDRDLGFVFKLVPLLLVIAAFSYLRENPFKINTELRLEGE
jgi:hypothetical protein